MRKPLHCALSGDAPFTSRQPLLLDGKSSLDLSRHGGRRGLGTHLEDWSGSPRQGQGKGGSRNHKANVGVLQLGDSALPPQVVVPPSKNVWKCQRGLGHRDTGGHGWGGPWSSLISLQGPPFLCPAGTAEAWVCVPMLDPHSAGMPALITTHLDGNKGDACLGGLLSCQHQGNATQSPCTACRAPRPASHRLVALGAPCSQAEEAAHCGPAWIPFLSASITYEGPETPSVLVPDTLKGKGAQGLLAAG